MPLQFLRRTCEPIAYFCLDAWDDFREFFPRLAKITAVIGIAVAGSVVVANSLNERSCAGKNLCRDAHATATALKLK